LSGRLTKSASFLGAIEFTYDDAGRLATRQVTGQGKATYSYDAVGNLLSAATDRVAASFGDDAAAQLRTVMRSNGVNTSYEYDGGGRLTALAHAGPASPLVTRRYAYDELNRIISVETGPGEPSQPTRRPTTNQYDAANRLL